MQLYSMEINRQQMKKKEQTTIFKGYWGWGWEILGDLK